jgi:hypothetical protein
MSHAWPLALALALAAVLVSEAAHAADGQLAMGSGPGATPQRPRRDP